MTNNEKFKEVFGFELNTDAFLRDYCVAKNNFGECKMHSTCVTCQYESWGESEYNEKTTRWIRLYHSNIYSCANCEWEQTTRTNYCPKCGLKARNPKGGLQYE